MTAEIRAADASPDNSRLAATLARGSVVLIAVASVVVLSLSFDSRLATAAANLPPDAVVWGGFLSSFGTPGYMFATSAVLLIGALVARVTLRSRRYDVALTLVAERASFSVATLAVSGLAAQLLKHLVGRARPWSFSSFGPYHFDVLSMKNSLASFPSGHTTSAFAMALALSLIAPRLRVALFTLALAIATSRIVVHAHYLSDVAGGALLGTFSALMVARFFADRQIAFTWVGAKLTLKGPKAVQGALLGGAGDVS